MKRNFFITFVTAVLIIACTNNVSNETLSSVNEKIISKRDYGKEWPFTVDQGILKCDNNAVIFISNGRTYGVNGTAKSRGRNQGYSDIEDIWAFDPLFSDGGNNEVRINIGPIISDGLKLCK